MTAPPMLINGGPSPAGWSRLGVILYCLQLYAHKYGGRGGSRQRSPPSEEMAIGTVLHTGVAHMYGRRAADTPHGVSANGFQYTSKNQLLPPDDAMAETAAIVAREDGVSVNVDNCIACIKAYFLHYQETWRVHHIEDVFTAAVADPDRTDAAGQPIVYAYTGRADLVVEIAGKFWVVDHKGMASSASPRSKAAEYSMSGQLIGWHWLGSQVYGAKFGGVMVNLIGRDAPFAFARPALTPAFARVRNFPQTIVDAERRLADMGDRPLDEYTPQLSGAEGCIGRFRDEKTGGCSALHICQYGRPNG